MNSIWLYLLIFIVKMIEVSIATLRIVLITKEERIKAGFIAFFEILIWITMVSIVLEGISEDPFKAVIYAAAFAVGNVVGSKIESKLGIGTVSVEVIVHKVDGEDMRANLRENGLAVTSLDAYGMNDRRELLIMRVPRRHTKKTVDLIKSIREDCVITVTDVKPIYGGYRVLRK